MKERLKELRTSIDRLSAISELYDELMDSKISSQQELESAHQKHDILRREALKASLRCKQLLKLTETKEKPK